MEATLSGGNVRSRTLILMGLGVVLAAALGLVARHYLTKPILIRGAVIQDDADIRKQSPILDVEVSVAGDPSASKAKSDFSGFFEILLHRRIERGHPITLEFRHPDYEPTDQQIVASHNLYVIRMVPLHRNLNVASNRPQTTVANVFVRYSVETTAMVNIGTGVKTFEVANKGNVPCKRRAPCSPDGEWKAAIGSGALDAGAPNTFQNARVSCIAGPCPFTKIQADHFSHGGRNIEASILNWSDTTVFLLQAEVFRQQVNGIVQTSYPVIFGQTLNFTLPPTAEGPSLEAEFGGVRMVFPLGPTPILSWAACSVRVEKDKSKSYRCELNPGYRFQ